MNWKIIPKAVFVLTMTAISYWNMPVALFAVAVVILVAVFDKADSLIEVSFGPLKAKLERNVSESEKLLSGLRSLALAQSKAVVAAASNTGRFASNDAWIYHTAKEIENGMKAIGSSPEELIEARSTLIKLILRDLGATATNGSLLPSFLGQEACAEWKAFRRSPKLSDPDFVEGWLKKYDVFGEAQSEVISAMRWIQTQQDIKDEAQYLLAKQELRLERQSGEML